MQTPNIGFASLLRRWWLLLALVTVAAALAAAVYGSRETPTYEASAELLVQAPSDTGAATEGAELAPTYAEVATSTQVLAFALRSTGLSVPLDDLRANVRGESDQDTRLIKVRVRDESAKRAVALANAVARGIGRYVASSQGAEGATRIGEARAQARVVEPADNAARIRPRLPLLMAFGAMAGLFGALAFVLVAEARRPRLRDADEISEIGDLAVLGSVNGGPPQAGSSGLARTFSDDPASFRRLAARIAAANGGAEPPSLLVIGVEGTEGSSAVAAKLALVLAGDGRRVVLAELAAEDGIRRYFPPPSRRESGSGLVASKPLRFRGTSLDRARFRAPLSLDLVFARGAFRVDLDAAHELVGLLAAEAELVIIHGPAPQSSRGALTWSRATEGTVVVVSAEHTSRASVEAALAGLEPVGANLLGAVLHRDRRWSAGATHPR